MKELTNYCWLLLMVILVVVGAVSAVPAPLYNTLQGYDGHHSQEDSPDKPAFLLADGLDVTYVWDGSINPDAWETVIFDTVGAHFGTVYAGDEGRNYIRTLETDHASASFDAYITVINYTDGQNVFIGMGAGDYGQYMCPDWLNEPTVWAELMEGAVNVLIWDGTNEDFLKPGGKVPASSTYLMRLSYDVDAQTIIFYTDADNDGTWDDISKECDVAGIFGEGDQSRIYVGTDDGGTLINFEVRPANAYMAYNYDPFNGATLVPDDKILSWQVGPDITDALFDVYLGTDPNEDSPNYYGNYKIAEEISNTSCDPDLEKDTTYYWRVDVLEPNETTGYIPHTGVMLTFSTVPYIPVITTQPVSQTVEIGGSVTFTVEGLNFETFAWYKEGGVGTILSDQQQLVLDDIQVGDEGRYYCAVSNDDGPGGATLTTMSDMASLWTKRLMAYWNFDDNLDSSQPLGPVWTGTAYMPDALLGDTVISPSYDADSISGKSLKFEADPNHVRINDSEYFFNFYINGFTAAAWLKPAEVGEWQLAVSKNNETITLGWGLGRYTDQAFANIRSAGIDSDYYGGSEINDGNWHLAVCQYDPDRATYSLFMDGTRVAESETVITPIPGSMVPLVIGAEAINGQAGFDGLVDDVRIWSYAISPLEIAKLYTGFYTDAEVCIEQGETWRYYDTVGQPGEPSYCKVDIEDFAEFMLVWMKCNIVPTCLQ
jgi:hypothetical protein